MASPNEDQEAHDDQQLKEAIDGLKKLFDGADDGVHDNQQLKAVLASLKDALSQLTANASGGCNMQLIEAAAVGWMDEIVKLLDQGADVNATEGTGKTPLMVASLEGHEECVRLMLDRGAQPDHQDKNGLTALLFAVLKGIVECVQLLLERGADVNHKDKDGDTALHFAAIQDKQFPTKSEYLKIVKVLLSQPGINPFIKNNAGLLPRDYATSFKAFTVFRELNEKLKQFPAHKYGKVVFCGHSGAGKSTLTQAIIDISKPATTRFANRVLRRQGVVESLTAGIVPHQIDSPDNNMIIYDLAGHRQYFSSHSAYLEAISLNSPAIFLLLQDLTMPNDVITMEVYYWSAMIDGVCHKCPQKSSVIVVGTHADLLTPEQVTRKLNYLQSVANETISHQNFVKVVALNTKDIYTSEMGRFKALLLKINKEVVSLGPLLPIHCNLLLAYLKNRIRSDVNAISLSDLLEVISNDSEKAIQPDILQIFPLLTTLSEKGLIVFIPSEDPSYSWIILHNVIILKEVNGVLFAGQQYTHLASNTGIVPIAVLQKQFAEYNIQMLIRFMIHYELCQIVNLTQVNTNMAPEGSFSPDLGPLLFFPALVSVDRPSSATLPNNSFCWTMIVKSKKKFFTTRFLHVLLHRLPFEFALPAEQDTPDHSHLNRCCTVWSRGIMWVSKTGVSIIVEMSKLFQSLSMAMSFPNRRDLKYLELVHSVLAVIKKACQEFCPHIEVLDVISCPPEASSDHSDDTKVEWCLLMQALAKGDKCTVDMSGLKRVEMTKWIEVEPCLSYLVGESDSVEPCTSLVPTCTSSQRLSEWIIENISLADQPTLPILLSRSHNKLNMAEQIGDRYLKFGIFLLEDETGVVVKALENEHLKNAERINTAIFQRWLEGRGMPVNWLALVTVLQNIGM